MAEEEMPPEEYPVEESAEEGGDWIGPENVSLEYLHAVFEAVGFTASIDAAKGAIRIEGDGIVARVQISEDNEQLMTTAFYTIKPTTSRDKRLELANRISQTPVMVKAWIDEDGDLGFRYILFLVGGVTPMGLANVVRTFIESVKFSVESLDTAGIIS